MATLYVTELAKLGYDANGDGVLAPTMPPLHEQAVTIGGSSAASNSFSSGANFVMISTDSACCIAIGASPTAVVGFHRVAANETRFYTLGARGQSVAVIASS
jgi:hypothetical protein